MNALRRLALLTVVLAAAAQAQAPEPGPRPRDPMPVNYEADVYRNKLRFGLDAQALVLPPFGGGVDGRLVWLALQPLGIELDVGVLFTPVANAGHGAILAHLAVERWFVAMGGGYASDVGATSGGELVVRTGWLFPWQRSMWFQAGAEYRLTLITSVRHQLFASIGIQWWQ